ncbi:MAG: hypothetical protein GC189_01360 [Alphaproteobacteria bacterium]|nr:hypothetical protein [Alphaproteobacteria bacterium]
MGFSATGLALDPVTGGWIVGNDGRAADPQPDHTPSIVFLEPSGARLLREIDLTALYPGHGSVQGVAVDPQDGDLWYAAVNDDLIRKIDRDTGAERARIAWPRPNGLAIATDGTLYVLSRRAVTHITQSGNVLRSFTVAQGDGLTVQPERALIWAADDDHAVAHDLITGALRARVRLPSINYAEGLVLCGDRLWVIHNGAFHRTSSKPASPPRALLVEFALPNDLAGARDDCPSGAGLQLAEASSSRESAAAP